MMSIAAAFPRRRGFSLFELMLVIAILGAILYLILPMISEIKARGALRASRQSLSAAFSSARAAAMQKARSATVTLTSSSASVTVVSATTGNTVTLVGPIQFTSSYGTVLTAIGSAPTSVVYDGRGIVSPVSTSVAKYRLSISSWADTVCISGAGVILNKSCQL